MACACRDRNPCACDPEAYMATVPFVTHDEPSQIGDLLVKIPVEYKDLRPGDEAIVKMFGRQHSVPISHVRNGTPWLGQFGIGPEGSDADIIFVSAERETTVEDVLDPIKQRLEKDDPEVLLRARQDLLLLIDLVERHQAALDGVLKMIKRESGICWSGAAERDDEEEANRGKMLDNLHEWATQIIAQNLLPIDTEDIS